MHIERRFLDDTDPECRRRSVALWRGMTVLEKAAVLSSASRAVHEVQLAGLRHRFPDASEEEIHLRSAVQRLGGSPTVSHAPQAPRLRSKRRAATRC